MLSGARWLCRQSSPILFFFSLFFWGGWSGGLSATLAHCATKTTRLCPKLNIPTPGPAHAEGSTHRRKSRAAGRADTLRFLEPFSVRLDFAKLLCGAASGLDEGERNPPSHTHARNTPTRRSIRSASAAQSVSEPAKKHNYERTSAE